MYSNRRNSVPGIFVFILVMILIIFVAMPVGSNYYKGKTYTATVTEKTVKRYHNEDKYLVFTKLDNGETRVFSIEDSFIKLRWNSSDVYGEIETGKTYEFEVIGWRIPFFSEYENIITFSEVKTP